MKNYWNNQSSTILAFAISLLFCIASQLTSFILLSRQISASSEDCLTKFKAVSNNHDERITLLELQNKNQDDGIQILNTEISDHRHQIGQLYKNANMVKYQPFYPSSSEKENGAAITDQLHVTRQEKQRAARLLPLSLLVGSDDEEPEIYSRPPTSCIDLNVVGHTVNGIYLIRKNNSSTSKIIDVVFCNFKPQKRSSIIVIENRLGQLNMNVSPSSGVYFYVQRYGILPVAPNGVIRFNQERLNIGGAMNLSTGVFTVPKAGIYHLSVTISKEGLSLDGIKIYIRVNGHRIGVSTVGATVTGAPATLNPILKLKKGDRVDVWKDNSFGILEYRSAEPIHHFSGWLLVEEAI